MAKKSKKQKSGVGTLILLLFASLILMIVTGYLAVCGYMGMGTGEMPSVFGTSLYVVQNDVDRVPSGSAIITDRTASGFEVGDPIVFYNPALETDNKIMFQYISEIDGDIYKTVNAANENPVDVSGNMLRGLAVSFTPFVGTVLTFAQTTTGTIIFIVVTIILIALFIYAFYQLFFGRRKRKKAMNSGLLEQYDDFEDDEIDARDEQEAHEEFVREYNKAKNKKAINEHFVPAYERLITGLEGLKGKGTNDKGLYYYPEGRKYYEYLVNASTGTSYSDVSALKQAINKQMSKELAAVNQLLSDDPSLGDKLDSSPFTLTEPKDILEDLKAQSQADFPPVNDCNYTIKNVPKTLEGFLSPAFYLTVPIDRPEDNSIYINNQSTDAGSLYTTMAHEGYPGHMYQTNYFNQHNTCNLRNVLDFQGYVEGWGTYAEYYAYTLDHGMEEQVGELLQHNAAFTLALYALLDINIHYEGWDMDQVNDYLTMYFQIDDPSVISSIYYEVVENPSNYLSYYTGYLEFLNMREEAQQRLGANFSLLEFNRFLLDIGPAPFSVIRNYFTQWLIQNGSSN